VSGTSVFSALAPVIAALEQLGVRYHIGGSVASSVYGVARSSVDIDVVADLEPHHAEPLVRSLGDRYYADLDAIATAIQRRQAFNLIHLATMIKVDVFVPAARAFDASELARARPRTLDLPEGTYTFTFKSAEDTVLRKLEWYRAGSEVSERQWNDVVGVLKVQTAALDQAYLRHWAAELGVDDLLQSAFDAVGLES